MIYEEWVTKDRVAQIDDVRAKIEQEMSMKMKILMKLEKARSRRKEADYRLLEGQPTKLMLKMRRRMRKADKKVEAKKIKNMAAQRKKDEATHKEDCQEAKKSRSVLKIMNHWKNIGESSRSAGKSPSNHDSDRISLVKKTASERKESEVRKNDDMEEEDDDNGRKTELQAKRNS